MATFDPLNAALLLVLTVALTWYLRDRFRAIDQRFDRIDKKLAETRSSVSTLHGRVDELSRDVVGLRSDIVQIALAVGARARPDNA